MHLNCSTIQELLSSYFDGELSAEQHGEVDSHLAACPACREEFSSLREMNAMLLNVHELSPSSRVDKLFAARLAANEAKRLRWAPVVYGRLAWAAGLAAMLLLAFLLYGRSRPPVNPSTIQTASVLPADRVHPPVIQPAAVPMKRIVPQLTKRTRQFRSTRNRPIHVRNTVVARVERVNTENHPVVTPATVEPDPTYATITEAVEPAPDISSTSFDEASLVAVANPPPEIAVMAMLTETTDY